MIENYLLANIATILVAHTELAMIKAQILNNRGYKLNVLYVPQANFLEKV
ncbi:hypothetical protein HBE96_24915 [Clostridium sp. P21]|uniref:Uncharacterized protein n=1 Tax=Clostridium muellerianum TaxID=2716538 RepID=A0A7Y0HSG7_9CLOT|nr:hypothetical protein [Clostridium muellerianum]NMM65823.1 hypothetical protein [Clostridium muellerianum]